MASHVALKPLGNIRLDDKHITKWNLFGNSLERGFCPVSKLVCYSHTILFVVSKRELMISRMRLEPRTSINDSKINKYFVHNLKSLYFNENKKECLQTENQIQKCQREEANK